MEISLFLSEQFTDHEPGGASVHASQGEASDGLARTLAPPVRFMESTFALEGVLRVGMICVCLNEQDTMQRQLLA